jgi:leader peptidase (prepilin peptidase)/N-methyltransferase
VLAATIALVAILCAISIADFRRQIIPDALNLALAGIGLAYQMATDGLPVHILFAAATFAAAWAIRRGHFLMTGRIGLGLGDVKMLAAAACWISPLLLPVLLFIASASALLFVGGHVLATGPAAARARVAFGPFIAIGLGCSWALEQFAGLNMGLL